VSARSGRIVSTTLPPTVILRLRRSSLGSSIGFRFHASRCQLGARVEPAVVRLIVVFAGGKLPA
jgi:hypothetical protein